MRHYAPLVRLPYNDVSGVVQVWADSCESMAVYEHEADASVKTTHIHMIMMNCQYATAEPLKRAFYKIHSNFNTKDGRRLWSWENEDYPVPDMGFLTYMSKGRLRPVFVKNISEQQLEEYRALWVEKTNTPDKPPVQKDEKESTKKLTKHQVIKAAYDYFQNKCPMLVNGQRDVSHIKNVPDTEILRCIRRILIDNEQVLGLYKVMDLYDGFMMYHNKEKFLSNCLRVIEKREGRI